MCAHLWAGQSRNDHDTHSRMVFLGCMWGFEMGARVSEYNRPEPGAVDHCMRVDDLTFTIVDEDGTRSVLGSNLPANFILTRGSYRLWSDGCWRLVQRGRSL